MEESDVAVEMIFLSQTVLGILGNSSLLYHHLILYFSDCRLRPTDFIVKHLIFANILSLLCKGIPQTMEAFGLNFFLSETGCKLLFYLHRLGRSVAISSTCLLSVLQAIIISSRDCRWTELKVKAPRYIGSSIFLSWILHILVNVIFLMYMTGKSSNTNITSQKDYGYCSTVRHNKTIDIFFAVLLSIPDVLCVWLMLWASSSMVFILYRHKQRMPHIHKTVSPRSSPESRATKTILLIVSIFVFFYMLSCTYQVFLAVIYNSNGDLVHTSAIVTGCFPTVSPFLLMSGYSRASRLCFAWIRRCRTSHVMSNMYVICFWMKLCC